MRILHVEDNEWDLRTARDALQEATAGASEIVAASTLEAARAALRDQRPDVVLLDLNLPDGSGLASIRAIRAAAADVPLVVLTGSYDESMGERALREGAQDHLSKGEVTGRALLRSLRYAIERARAAKAEGDLRRELARAQQEAARREGLTALGTLVMGVAHEVNNPLAFMSLALSMSEGRVAEVLEKTKDEAQASELRASLADHQTIHRGVERLTEISRALQRLRRSASEPAHDIDAAAVVMEAVSQGAFPDEALARIDVEAPEPLPVHGSRSDLGWLVRALVANALEAMAGREGHVRVRAGRERERAFIEVADTGVGIAAGDRPRVFVPFFTTKPDRTGLSLARAYSIAEAHKGRLGFLDGPAGGTIFRLELPLASSS